MLIIIKNKKELEKFAKFLAVFLEKNFFLLLYGKIGSGKTTLVNYLAKTLQAETKISSPTFNVLHQHVLKNEKNTKLNHFDFFRLKKEKHLLNLLPSFEEIVLNNVNIIEWPEIVPHFWKNKKKKIRVEIETTKKKEERIIKLIFNLK